MQWDVTIDLIASRTNCQVSKYIYWRLDPGAVAIDAFTINWNSLQFWCFPPFSLIPRVIKKIREDQATGLLVVPNWPTQPWYPQVMQLLTDHPRVLPKRGQLLILPEKPQETHSLQGKLELLVCLLSGNSLRTRDYHSSLQISSLTLGDRQRSSSTCRTFGSGRHTAVNNKLIPFIQTFPRF